MILDILIVCREVPSVWNVSTNKIFYLTKYFKAQKYNCTIICFKNQKFNEIYNENEANILAIEPPTKIGILESFFFSLFLILKSRRILPLISPQLKQQLDDLISTKQFNIILVDQLMARYVSSFHKECPVILDVVDPLIYSLHENYLNENNPIMKILKGLNLLRYKYLHIPCYLDYEYFCFVTQIHHKLLEQHLPKWGKYYYIPQGVNISYFSPSISCEEESNTILFTGGMRYGPNESAVIFFVENIFPLIKKIIPSIKFYVVGIDPSPKILNYNSENIIVTGFVEDTRKYFNRTCVVVVPIILDDGGYKMKVLEAMAMAKPCVSTSLGVKGLNVEDGVNVIVADNPQLFADTIIKLLMDKVDRKTIGRNARRLVERNYSTENMCELINKTFQEIIKKNNLMK
jgi:polysaccharide biosynthesis protein PslH